MYAQVEKSKENKGMAIANSLAQKNNRKQDSGFVDNRLTNAIQRYSQKEATFPEGFSLNKERIGFESKKTETNECKIKYHDKTNKKDFTQKPNNTIQMILASIVLHEPCPTDVSEGPMIKDLITAREGDMEKGGTTTGGPHTSAFILSERTMIDAVSNKTYKRAAEALKIAYEWLKQLPGMEYEDSDGLEARIDQALGSALMVDPMAIDPQRRIFELQNAIVEWLKIRNSVPLSMRKGISGTKESGTKQVESKAYDWMKEAQGRFNDAAPDYKDKSGAIKKHYAKGMFQGYDFRVYKDNPGAQKDAIEQHIMTCFMVVPIANDIWRETIEGMFKSELRNYGVDI